MCGMMNTIRFKPRADSLSKSKNTLIVSATQGNSFEGTPLFRSLVEQDYNGDVALVTNNKLGLCKLYNKYIDSNYDVIFFIHDDVYIDSVNFVEKAINGFKQFDVIGLAGGSNIKIEKPLLWHLMTNKDTWSGVVSHKVQNNTFLPTTFGPIGRPVILLDGLFIGIQPKKLKEKNIRFDENIKGFHHYDLKFCVDCFRADLKLGTVPIHVVHESPGLKEFSNSFRESEEYFYQQLKSYVKK